MEHTWLIILEEYQTVFVALFGMVLGVFIGITGSIYGYLRFKEVRLRTVERALGHRVLEGEEQIATVSVVKACGARLEKSFTVHVEEEDKRLTVINDDIKYIRGRLETLPMELIRIMKQ